MIYFDEFNQRFLNALRVCNVPTMPVPGVDSRNANIETPCDYANSVIYLIADGYQRSMGFSSLIAYKNSTGALVAVRLTDVTDKCIEISKCLGMIYGAPYRRTVRGYNNIVYYI